MLFSEVYSAYYRAVTLLVNEAIEGKLNEKTAVDIIGQSAFSESFLYIINAIKSEEWQVITKEFDTPIKHKTSMPLTSLELRFLKGISMDPRFALFMDSIEGLEDVKPLYLNEDLHFTDMICDGDPYTSQEYRKIFRTVLQGLREKRKLEISFVSGKGYAHRGIYIPRKLEYSQKDDKFRLHCKGRYRVNYINLARITACELLDFYEQEKGQTYEREKKTVILEIFNERNALERAMLHFANFEKETLQLGGQQYQMKLTYYGEDETEVLIRVLSFGPMVKAIEPSTFINQIKQRLENQKKLRIK